MTTLLLLMGGRPDAEGGASGFTFLMPLLLIMVIYYWLLIRPQQKQSQRHRELLESLKKGDDVVTDSGLVGTIVSLQDDFVVIKADDNVKLKFLKSKVATKVSAMEEAKQKEKKS
jgi:preprotein translocase subunit YajC